MQQTALYFGILAVPVTYITNAQAPQITADGLPNTQAIKTFNAQRMVIVLPRNGFMALR